MKRESWHVVTQQDEWICPRCKAVHEAYEEHEVLTIEGGSAQVGATIDMTDGRRITLLEPAGEEAA